jgi:hypothetical protein
MYSDFDDTLPLPDEVEAEFRDKAGDNLTALAWLTDHGIDSAPSDRTEAPARTGHPNH